LLNSRSHSTELATTAQRSQSPKLKLTVEKLVAEMVCKSPPLAAGATTEPLPTTNDS
jgi:hypothetical protein